MFFLIPERLVSNRGFAMFSCCERGCFFLFHTAKAGLADFIQPSLGPLQPNLDDIMDLEPLTGNEFQGERWLI